VGGALLLIVVTTLLAVAFAAASVGIVWWALFGDKPRGRRRCPRCWHDLSGTPGSTCGECGFVAADESDFLRIRRRWLLAITALLSVVGVAAWTQLSILDATWASYLPDAAIARLPRLLPLRLQPAPVIGELRDRLARGSMDADAIEALVASVTAEGRAIGASDDPAAVVLWAVTRTAPGELEPGRDDPQQVLAEKAKAREAHRSSITAMLDALPAWIEVEPPVRWPRGAVPMARVRGTVWGSDAEWRMRARGPSEPWLVGENMAGFRRLPTAAALALPDPDADGRLRGRVEVEVRRRDADGAWGEWTALPAIALDAPVAELDAAQLVDTDDAGIAAAIRECFDFPATAWDDPERPIGIRFGTRSFGDPAFADLLVGVTVDLCEGGVVRRRSRLWWAGGGIDRTGWVIEREDVEALRRLREIATASRTADDDGSVAAPGWTIRATGDRETAYRAVPRDPVPPVAGRAWTGSVEWPLRARGTPERAPRRIYRLEFPD
jgi:hypothetical protein